jgi:hypothetical protein
LPVFCCGVVLSFSAHAAIELAHNTLVAQVAAGTAGILFLTALAHVLDLAGGGGTPSSGPAMAR